MASRIKGIAVGLKASDTAHCADVLATTSTTSNTNANVAMLDEGFEVCPAVGAVATIMALDRAIRCGNDTSESVYDSRGLLVL